MAAVAFSSEQILSGEISRFSDDGTSQATEEAMEEAQRKTQEIAAKETKAVRILRVVLGLVLTISAGTLAALVYYYTRKDETDEFEEAFYEFYRLIEDTVQINAQNRLEAIGALSTQIQAYALSSQSVWPFVTVPFFERQVHAMKSLTDAYAVLMFPVIRPENRREWESYTRTAGKWVNDSYDAQIDLSGSSGEVLPTGNETWWDILWGPDFETDRQPSFESGIGDHIFSLKDPYNNETYGPIIPDYSPNTTFYAPQWHAAPLDWYYQSTVNQDYTTFSDFLKSTEICIDTGEAVLGEAWSDGYSPGFITTMLYPIYEEFHAGNKTVVGFLGADIFWQDYLKDILPKNAEGIFVIIENTIGQHFTYELFGATVNFVGEEDLHEKEYDYMMESFLFGAHLHDTNDGAEHGGAALHDGFIQYTLRVYPSKQLEENYVTKTPVWYTVFTCAIFVFTSVVFFIYDCIVEKRQKLVLETALKSDAIVSSLFPNTVKERLYGNEDREGPLTNGDAPRELSEQNLHDIMDRLDEAGHRDGPPIAELYQDATVFFADIVGFTSWSSGRPPVDVFLLLETCYGAIDTIAKRRSVFKVETIGDCYVAVTGLPEPQEDHAVIMVRFARDMLLKFKKEVLELRDVLGPDTVDLSLRIGMHSGPVTAGVLRGEKARFQLFGDTMNTAARMESTSKRGRIQLSESTANLLFAAGKGHWLDAREDKVSPKGKGEMQTYWVKPSIARSAVTESERLVESNDTPPVDTLEEEGDLSTNEDDGNILSVAFSDE